MAQAQILVGTYTTDRASEGLYWCEVGDDGSVRVVSALPMRDPSFVALHPSLPVAYVVNEVPESPGLVSRIAVDLTARRLELLETVSAEGHLPCHLALTMGGRFLWVANYGSGNVSVYRLDGNGAFTGSPQLLRHSGQSLHPRRQASPHPHCVAVHPNGRDIHVTDLGTDRIEHYRHGSAGHIDRNDGFTATAGSGPRHLKYSRNGRRALLSCELDNTLSLFAVRPNGSLELQRRVSTLPADFTGRSFASEVAFHPNEQIAYVGNRGHDSIARIVLDTDEGIEWIASGGAHPRHFACTPDGKQLVIANRDSDNLVVRRIDESSGRPAGAPVVSSVPAPAVVCCM